MSDEDNLKEFMLKEIDITQDIIKRMANNSFLIKGWTITLVVVTLLLKNDDGKVYISFIPLLSFWALDAYFLRQERLFRKLYQWIVENRLINSNNLFSMDTSKFEPKVGSIIDVMFSKTLLLFYGSIGLLLVIYIVLLKISLLNNLSVLLVYN